MISRYWNVQFLNTVQIYHLVTVLSFFFFFNKCFPIRQYKCWSGDWKYHEEKGVWGIAADLQNPREPGGETEGAPLILGPCPGWGPVRASSWAQQPRPPADADARSPVIRPSLSQESQTLRIHSYQLKVTIDKPLLSIFTKPLNFKLGRLN